MQTRTDSSAEHRKSSLSTDRYADLAVVKAEKQAGAISAPCGSQIRWFLMLSPVKMLFPWLLLLLLLMLLLLLLMLPLLQIRAVLSQEHRLCRTRLDLDERKQTGTWRITKLQASKDVVTLGAFNYKTRNATQLRIVNKRTTQNEVCTGKGTGSVYKLYMYLYYTHNKIPRRL